MIRTVTGAGNRPSRGRRWWAAGLLAALLVAGVASYYASSRPDGLQQVSATLGFADRESASTAESSPLAGYQTSGVEDGRLSGGLAGAIGTLAVLGLGGGLFWLVRSRPRDES